MKNSETNKKNFKAEIINILAENEIKARNTRDEISQYFLTAIIERIKLFDNKNFLEQIGWLVDSLEKGKRPTTKILEETANVIFGIIKDSPEMLGDEIDALNSISGILEIPGDLANDEADLETFMGRIGYFLNSWKRR